MRSETLGAMRHYAEHGFEGQIQLSHRPERPRVGAQVTLEWSVLDALDDHALLWIDGRYERVALAGTRVLTMPDHWLGARLECGPNRSELIAIQPQLELHVPAQVTAIMGSRVEVAWRASGAREVQLVTDGNSRVVPLRGCLRFRLLSRTVLRFDAEDFAGAHRSATVVAEPRYYNMGELP